MQKRPRGVSGGRRSLGGAYPVPYSRTTAPPLLQLSVARVLLDLYELLWLQVEVGVPVSARVWQERMWPDLKQTSADRRWERFLADVRTDCCGSMVREWLVPVRCSKMVALEVTVTQRELHSMIDEVELTLAVTRRSGRTIYDRVRRELCRVVKAGCSCADAFLVGVLGGRAWWREAVEEYSATREETEEREGAADGKDKDRSEDGRRHRRRRRSSRRPVRRRS